MTNRILILNCGSSSIKFRLYADVPDREPELLLRGQVDGLYGRASFAAKDANDSRVGQHEWNEASPPGHDGAVAWLLDWLRQRLGAPLQDLAPDHLDERAGARRADDVGGFAAHVRAELEHLLERLQPPRVLAHDVGIPG